MAIKGRQEILRKAKKAYNKNSIINTLDSIYAVFNSFRVSLICSFVHVNANNNNGYNRPALKGNSTVRHTVIANSFVSNIEVLVLIAL